MTWRKQGLIFNVDGNAPWMRTHAQIPVVECRADVWRIYFGTRDAESRTSTGFVDVSARDPKKIVRVSDRPVLAPGPRGAFDDCGAMPSCLTQVGKRKYLYYIGWNVRNTVPYHNSIGVAVSDDGGETFARLFDGPILDRSPHDPYFVVTPFVIVENGVWRMWYSSCTGWTVVSSVPEPRYLIKYAESKDGIRWEPRDEACIPSRSDDEVSSRPIVARTPTGYRMWYCFRSIRDYRTSPDAAYRLGYAESADGRSWTRLDERAGLPRSDRGWDSGMVAYPFVFSHGGVRYLLYNGNGFGKSGIGYATADAAD